MKLTAKQWLKRTLPVGIACMVAAIVLVLKYSDQDDASFSGAEPSSARQRQNSASNRFAGSKTCHECHAVECHNWSTNPMSQSARTVSDHVAAATQGLSDFSTSAHVSYRVEIRDREMIHHEMMSDVNGDQIYCQSEPVHYVIGSGQQGHAFLIHRPNMLFVSPVNWYKSSGSWGLAPGYDPKAHNRFERRVTDACINCHAGTVRDDQTAVDRFEEPMFDETSIGCERCHGPAAEHVAFQRGDRPTDSIINPSSLDHARRDAVCNQCHVQGVERVLRVGRSEFDFRPGMLLSDVWSVFVSEGSSSESSKAVSHFEQLQASRCFTESKERLGCISCHDVHSSGHDAAPEVVYRTKCLQCHSVDACTETDAVRTSANDSCIKCHMPAGSASDVPHAVHTNHQIVRRPQQVDHSSEKSVVTKVKRLHEDGAKPLTDAENWRARGIALARLLDRGQQLESTAVVEKLLRDAKNAYPDDPAICESLGIVLDRQGRTFEASVIWKAGLKLDPANESILFRLARLSHDAGDLEAAAGLLKQFIAINPWHASIHARYAHVLGLQGRFAEAIPSAERAIELDPSLIQVRGWLIEAYRQTGQNPLELEQQRIYDRMSPITGVPDAASPTR